MNFLHVQMICITDLYDCKFLHCNNFICLVCFCMFLTCSTSYCLVTVSGVYGMHICMYVCVYVQLHSFLTSALDEGKWSASRPGCFILLPPQERTHAQITQKGGWAPKPECMFWERQKSLTPAVTRTPYPSARSEPLYRLTHPGFHGYRRVSNDKTFVTCEQTNDHTAPLFVTNRLMLCGGGTRSV